jgi:hypothetical protein
LGTPGYTSIRSLIKCAENALGDGKINDALLLVHDFVEKIITEPLCTAQVFSSSDLDRLCLSIGRHTLSYLGVYSANISEEIRGNVKQKTVYIVSRLQSAGGHSRLINDFIQNQPDKDHLILLTEVGGPSDTAFFKSRFSSKIKVELLSAPKGDFYSRLLWLQSQLVSANPEHIHLFNSHQDSVAVSALVPELGFPTSFYHHCDHHLSLGVHMNHVRHIDLHPMGYHYCREKLGIDNRYLPMTSDDLGLITDEDLKNDALTTATVARSNKVETPYFVSYIDLIPKILKVTGGKHVHIGRLSLYARLKIRNQLRKLGINLDRFVYFDWTASVWKSMQEHGVDLYINSFPYASGLTLIEVMGAGIPVVMHQHIYSRTLSALEMSYLEAFCWTVPEDLLKHLANIDLKKLAHEKKLARAQYEKFHRPEILKGYLRDYDSILTIVPSPMRKIFHYHYDEWGALIESQVSFSKLLYRLAYRSWLKIRK